jgi:predicted NUDIX family NTP pyrophosphohydrolase
VAGTPNPREVDEVRWISVEEAYTKLSYRSDRALLARVENQLAGH